MTKGRVLCIGLMGIGRLLAASTCEALANLSLPDTAIATAVSVPAGSYTAPDGTSFPNLPAFCRVAGSIQPAADSNIEFEVWLPNSQWNGKFAGADNGGFGGAINYAKIGDALSHNYAAASTDTGHTAGSLGVLDASWALGHPEKVTDYGYRAIHQTAQMGQAILAAFYGQRPGHSYFNGCSNGGRQALMEAQRYPEDYDGIIAGSPAHFMTHLFATGVWDNQALTVNYLPPSKLPAIEAAALAACDGLDGVVDGVIDDPRKCHFDPSTLLCQGAETDACLTLGEIATLSALYAGPVNSAGVQVFPGYPVGGQTGANGWPLWVTGPSQGTGALFGFGYYYFVNMVYGNPAWNPYAFNVDSDVAAADADTGATLNAMESDLTAFRERGGKLILFHGWSDPAIAAGNTIQLLPERAIEFPSNPQAALYSLVSCARHAALPIRPRAGQFRPERLRPGRPATRPGVGSGTLGRARRRSGTDHRHQIQYRPRPRQRRGAHAALVRLSHRGPLDGTREYRRRREL